MQYGIFLFGNCAHLECSLEVFYKVANGNQINIRLTSRLHVVQAYGKISQIIN